MTNISVTVDFGAFEILVVKVLDCSLQIGVCFKFDESGDIISQGLISNGIQRPTLSHHDRARPRRKQRQDQSGVQNL